MIRQSILRLASAVVRHDKGSMKFIGSIEGVQGDCVLSYRMIQNKHSDFYSTLTDHRAQGKGLAGEVVGTACRWAKLEGISVRPTCSYVEAFMNKRDEFRGIIKW